VGSEVVWRMEWVLLTWWHPSCLSCLSCLSFAYLSPPSLPTPTPPWDQLPAGGVVCSSRWVWMQEACEGGTRVHLVEFQTPTIFDCGFGLHCSTFVKSLKIVKIIIYIHYIRKNVSPISIWPILICGLGYVAILFRSCIISFYINIPRWFGLLHIHTTKQLSHGN
jgi:hypothetical protein